MKGTGQAGQGVSHSGCLVVLLHFCCSGLGTAACVLGTGRTQILTGREHLGSTDGTRGAAGPHSRIFGDFYHHSALFAIGCRGCLNQRLEQVKNPDAPPLPARITSSCSGELSPAAG